MADVVTSAPVGNVSPGNITCDDVQKLNATMIADRMLERVRSNLKMAGMVDRYQFECGQETQIPYPTGNREPRKKYKTKPIEVSPSTFACKTVSLDCHIYDAMLIEDSTRLLNCYQDRSYIDALCNEAIYGIANSIEQSLMNAYAQACWTIDAKAEGINKDVMKQIRRVMAHMKTPISNLRMCLGIDAYTDLLCDDELVQASLYKCEGFDALGEGSFQKWLGIQVMESETVPTVDGCDQNLVFDPRAIVLSTLNLTGANTIQTKFGNFNSGDLGVAVANSSQNDLNLRVMMSYSHAHMGWILSWDMIYGVDVLVPEWLMNVQTTFEGVGKAAPEAGGMMM